MLACLVPELQIANFQAHEMRTNIFTKGTFDLMRTFPFRQNVLGALHVFLLDGHVHGALLVPSGGELQII